MPRSTTLSKTLLFCLGLLAARAASADEPSTRPVFGRLSASVVWLEAATTGGFARPFDRTQHDVTGAFGFVLLEAGFGVRLSDRVSLGAFGRVGLVQLGGGLELAVRPSAPWSRDGWTLRLAPMLLGDGVTCGLTSTEAPHCNVALYVLVEAGPEYRWAFSWGGALSLGVAFNAGAVRMNVTEVRWFPAVGVMGPKLHLEF